MDATAPDAAVPAAALLMTCVVCMMQYTADDFKTKYSPLTLLGVSFVFALHELADSFCYLCSAKAPGLWTTAPNAAWTFDQFSEMEKMMRVLRTMGLMRPPSCSFTCSKSLHHETRVVTMKPNSEGCWWQWRLWRFGSAWFTFNEGLADHLTPNLKP